MVCRSRTLAFIGRHCYVGSKVFRWPPVPTAAAGSFFGLGLGLRVNRPGSVYAFIAWEPLGPPSLFFVLGVACFYWCWLGWMACEGKKGLRHIWVVVFLLHLLLVVFFFLPLQVP